MRRVAGRPRKVQERAWDSRGVFLFISLDLFFLLGNPARFYSQWTEPAVSAKSQTIKTKASWSWSPWHFIPLPTWQAKSSSWCSCEVGGQTILTLSLACSCEWPSQSGSNKASRMDRSLKQPLRTIKTDYFSGAFLNFRGCWVTEVFPKGWRHRNGMITVSHMRNIY